MGLSPNFDYYFRIDTNISVMCLLANQVKAATANILKPQTRMIFISVLCSEGPLLMFFNKTFSCEAFSFMGFFFGNLLGGLYFFLLG